MNKLFHKIKSILRQLTAFYDRRHYKLSKIIIVSNNCFGGEIYKRHQLVFNTPFIGLFIPGSDYIKLLLQLDHYLEQPLIFTEISKFTNKRMSYPIANLKDVEIHFMHYKTQEEVLEKWQRRLKRFNQCLATHQLIFKFCDRDGATQEELEKFHNLPYDRKISFGTQAYQKPNHITIKEVDNGRVPDGVKLYVLCQRYFDLYHWVKRGEIKYNWYSHIKSYLDIA